MDEIVKGDGWAVASLHALGDAYGFRKIRGELGVTAFGVNALVLPPGYGGNPHYHDEQEELYFVHKGEIEFELGDVKHVLGPGGVVRVSPSTVRCYRNVGDEDAVLLAIGAKDGYVGRDGRVPEGVTERVRGPEAAA